MPRWLTLSIGLGSGHFAERQTLGLAIRAACTVGFELAPFIRSTQDGDKQDTILSDTCQLQPVARTSVLLHSIMPREALTRAGDNHTLILPLPKQDFTLDLHDMRLFHIERPDNTAAPRRTITSVAY